MQGGVNAETPAVLGLGPRLVTRSQAFVLRPVRASLGGLRELDTITLVRAQRGDRKAMTSAVQMYQDRIYAVVSRVLAGRPELRDDVAQDALVKIVRALPRFDPNGPARLSTWMITIATRTCIDALRVRVVSTATSGQTLSEPEGCEPVSEAPDPERQVAARELGAHVGAAMAKLPADQRAALVLRAYHDFDYPEIAETLEISVGTVKSRIGRAREALRKATAEVRHD